MGRTRGMLLGKFMPPHAGHQFLIDFARNYVDDLTVLVCTLEREPIDGALRFAWMKEICGGARAVHVTDDVPQEPSEHPEFWSIWRELVGRYVPEKIDYVFASEDYGLRLARELEAEFVPVDPKRCQVPVSATMIRENPMESWEYLPRAVRPHYVRRVCLFGPESTGKTTLAAQLADHFDTLYVTEYARPLLEPKRGVCDFDDIERIARGQMAAEDALARQANRILFCDTDLLTTTIWSDVLFGKCPSWIGQEACKRRYDLTLLLDIDVPWVDDEQRYLGEEREAFMERCVATLEASGRPYLRVSGDYEERFSRACAAVDQLLFNERRQAK